MTLNTLGSCLFTYHHKIVHKKIKHSSVTLAFLNTWPFFILLIKFPSLDSVQFISGSHLIIETTDFSSWRNREIQDLKLITSLLLRLYLRSAGMIGTN